jgi:hypothetical protein
MLKLLKSPLYEVLKFIDDRDLCRMQQTCKYFKKHASEEVLKFIDDRDLCRMQQTCKYFKKHASEDFLWRFLLQSKQLTFVKGFKQNWLAVYK